MKEPGEYVGLNDLVIAIDFRVARLFLYVAIPLGSWVGGARVERLLGAALDELYGKPLQVKMCSA